MAGATGGEFVMVRPWPRIVGFVLYIQWGGLWRLTNG